MADIEFDPRKSRENERTRGLPFDLVAELDWSLAVVAVDGRRDYGEERLIAYVPMQGRLHVVCYTRRGQTRRVISFRKANKREEHAYEQAAVDR